MTQEDLVELSRLFTLWLAGLPGEHPVREVAEEVDKLIARDAATGRLSPKDGDA